MYANFIVNSIIQFANDMKHFGNKIQCAKYSKASEFEWITLHVLSLNVFDLDGLKTTPKSFYMLKKRNCLVLLINRQYSSTQKALMWLKDHKQFPIYYRKNDVRSSSKFTVAKCLPFTAITPAPLYITNDSLFIVHYSVLSMEYVHCTSTCTSTSMRR